MWEHGVKQVCSNEIIYENNTLICFVLKYDSQSWIIAELKAVVKIKPG